MKLTAKKIETIDDEDLLDTIFDHLSVEDEGLNPYETVAGWNDGKRAIYVICLLEAEVNNGGFNQFYINSSGVFRHMVPTALKLIKAEMFASLVERANDIYENNWKQIEPSGDLIQDYEAQFIEQLDPLDDEFYELYEQENLAELQIAYIREHTEEFV